MKIKKLINKILKKTRTQKNILDIDYETLQKIVRTNNDAFLIDVRSPQEFKENRIDSAINIPLYELENRSKILLPNKNSHIIFYCQSGTRSKKACKLLQKLGYSNLYNLNGGINNI